MGQRSHSLAPRPGPGRAIVTSMVLVIALLGGCSTGHSSSTGPGPTTTDSAADTGPTTTATDPGTAVPAGDGRLIEFSVMAHGVDTDQTFRTTGPGARLRYGNGRLTGLTTIDGAPAGAELLAQVGYDDGSGPFTGFWTFTFTDGSDLVLRYAGRASRSDEDTTIIGDLTVFGGTGGYASVTGGGTVHGERTVALGGDVDYRFTLTLSGLPAEPPSPVDR